MNRANATIRRQRSEVPRRRSHERCAKSKKLRKDQFQKENKQKQPEHCRGRSPLKRFLQLRLGQVYSSQLAEMLKMLQKEKKIKSIIDNGQEPQRKRELEERIEFLRSQQQILINKINVQQDIKSKSNVQLPSENLVSLFRYLGGDCGVQLTQQYVCHEIKRYFDQKSKAISVIFTKIEELLAQKPEQKKLIPPSFKQVIVKLKRSLQGSKKNKENTNDYMRKILQLEKGNVKLTKECRKIQEQFQYLVEEKLLLENKLDRSRGMIASMEQQRDKLKSSVTSKLNSLSIMLQELKQLQTRLKDQLSRRQHLSKQQVESLSELITNRLSEASQQTLRKEALAAQYTSIGQTQQTEANGQLLIPKVIQSYSPTEQLSKLKQLIQQLQTANNIARHQLQEKDCILKQTLLKSNQDRNSLQFLEERIRQLNKLTEIYEVQNKQLKVVVLELKDYKQKEQSFSIQRENMSSSIYQLDDTIKGLEEKVTMLSSVIAQLQARHSLQIDANKNVFELQMTEMQKKTEKITLNLEEVSREKNNLNEQVKCRKLTIFLFQRALFRTNQTLRITLKDLASHSEELISKRNQLSDIKSQIRACQLDWMSKQQEYSQSILKVESQFQTKEHQIIEKIQTLETVVQQITQQLLDEKAKSQKLQASLQKTKLDTVNLCKPYLENLSQHFLQKVGTLQKMNLQLTSSVKRKIESLEIKHQALIRSFAWRVKKETSHNTLERNIQQFSTQQREQGRQSKLKKQVQSEAPLFHLISQHRSQSQINQQEEQTDHSNSNIQLSQSVVWNFMNDEIINEEVALLKTQLEYSLREIQYLKKKIPTGTTENQQQVFFDFS